MATFVCRDCKLEKPVQTDGGTGYGIHIPPIPAGLLSSERKLVETYRAAKSAQRAAMFAETIYDPQASGPLISAYRESEGLKICFDCCAKRDCADMIKTGKAVLYLSRCDGEGYTIGNWPGSLKFPAKGVKRFRHPFVREAWLGTFKGPDGKLWRFKNVGDNQVAYCQRAAG